MCIYVCEKVCVYIFVQFEKENAALHKKLESTMAQSNHTGGDLRSLRRENVSLTKALHEQEAKVVEANKKLELLQVIYVLLCIKWQL